MPLEAAVRPEPVAATRAGAAGRLPGSTQVALLGLAYASDRDIRDHAAQHGCVIVTKDADFRDMAVLHGVPPRIIWLRSGNGPRQAVAERLLAARPMLEAAFADPATVCIELC